MTGYGSLITGWAETSRRLLSGAGAIALRANEQIAKGTFDTAQCARSTQQLADLALTAGLEMAPRAMRLSMSSPELELSDFIEVAPDNDCERVLSVAAPFVADGEPSWVIPDRFIVFVPAILRVYAKRFRVASTWPDLRSGTYRGRVRLTRLMAGGDEHPDRVDVVVDL
jgi:hypothetical protein